MSNKFLNGVLLCLFLSVGLAGRVRAEQIHNFLVLYSSNVHGEMEPCG